MTGVPGQPPFDFETHRREAIAEYQRRRPLYEEFTRVIEGILTEALRNADIKVATIEARAKSLESFGDKSAEPAEADSTKPKYANPLTDITDLAAARVITFFLSTIPKIDKLISTEFLVRERADKADVLMKEERLGYRSVHYVVQLTRQRTALAEYARYAGLDAEIQLHTVLQHAWAEIEHDIQYKSVTAIPIPIRRRFIALAGLLEIADREFEEIQSEDERLRLAARKSVELGHLDQVEITADSLKAYLDKKLGPDGRMRQESYEVDALMLRGFGFANMKQVDECIAQYDDDSLSRMLWGSRQGQLSRFEDMLLAGIGQEFINRHSLGHEEWWRKWREDVLDRMRAHDISVGSYDPKAGQNASSQGRAEI